jgi:hypothetical protein
MMSETMTPEQSATFARLLSEHTDNEGKIRPSPEAYQHVEAVYGHRQESEKHQLAQAQTLIDLQERAMGSPESHRE